MKLSIITINYNNLEGLKRTYESVVCQTWTDYEWIIIDGGSTDGSREFIEEHQDKFSYWCSEPDKGVYNAMNKGIAKAKGEYLNFMNSGDSFYETNTLMKVFSREHEADIVYGDILRIYEEGECIYRFGTIADIFTLYQHNIPHQAMFIRLEYHRHHLYDEDFGLMADWKNWVLAALNNVRFEYAPIVVARYPMDGLSSIHREKCDKEYELIKDLFPYAVRQTVEEFESYRNCRSTVRAHLLVRKGGVAAFITKGIMKVLASFFHIRMY